MKGAPSKNIPELCGAFTQWQGMNMKKLSGFKMDLTRETFLLLAMFVIEVLLNIFLHITACIYYHA